MSAILSVDPELRDVARVPSLAGVPAAVRPAELAALLLAGALAALLTTFVKPGLGIPGHSILFAVFPMAFGLALVPRRGAGTTMGAGALFTMALLTIAGARVPGVGALTSLLAVGPLLDVALRWGRRGWRLHAGFIAAGALANAAAFLVRGAAKASSFALVDASRPLAAWWSSAIVTYTAAGMIAGLVSAMAWFQLRGHTGDDAAR